MDRKHFMFCLKQSLQDFVSEPELDEILSDHHEFFETGLAEGETEDQVAERLGDPAKIALSLLQKGSSPQTHEFSGPGKPDMYKRVLAFVIDIFVASFPFMILSPRFALTVFFYPGLLAGIVPSLFSTIKNSSMGWIVSLRSFWFAGVVFAALWFVVAGVSILTLSKGRTVGKWLLGLRLTRPTGELPTLGQYFIREILGKYGLNTLFGAIWLPLAFVPAVGSLIWCLFSPEGKTVWDVIAGTRVVQPPVGGKGA